MTVQIDSSISILQKLPTPFSVKDLPLLTEIFEKICSTEMMINQNAQTVEKIYHFFVFNTESLKSRQDLLGRIFATIEKTHLIAQFHFKLYKDLEVYSLEKLFWSCHSEYFRTLFSYQTSCKFLEVKELQQSFALLKQLLENPLLLKWHSQEIRLDSILEVYKLTDRLLIPNLKTKIENDYLKPCLKGFFNKSEPEISEQEIIQKIFALHLHYSNNFYDWIFGEFCQKGIIINQDLRKIKLNFDSDRGSIFNNKDLVWVLLPYPFLADTLDGELYYTGEDSKRRQILRNWREELKGDFYFKSRTLVTFEGDIRCLNRLKALVISHPDTWYDRREGKNYQSLERCQKLETLIFNPLREEQLRLIPPLALVNVLHITRLELNSQSGLLPKIKGIASKVFSYFRSVSARSIQDQLIHHIKTHYFSLKELTWPENIPFDLQNPPLLPAIRILNIHQENLPSKELVKRVFDKHPFLDEIRFICAKPTITISNAFSGVFKGKAFKKKELRIIVGDPFLDVSEIFVRQYPEKLEYFKKFCKSYEVVFSTKRNLLS